MNVDYKFRRNKVSEYIRDYFKVEYNSKLQISSHKIDLRLIKSKYQRLTGERNGNQCGCGHRTTDHLVNWR